MNLVDLHFNLPDNFFQGTQTETLAELSEECELSDCYVGGAERPWRKNKLLSLAVSDALKVFEDLKSIGYCIENCGCVLVFKKCPNGHGKRLYRAYFCKRRSCILCAWRKSIMIFHQVLDLLHKSKEKNSSDIYLFLTLTIPNCKGFELKESIKKMSGSLKKFFERRRVKYAVRGWFRSLEVTYNKVRLTYHPHYHIILVVPKNYFDSRKGLYLSQDQWLELWRESMQDNSITQVDIRRIKRRKKGQELPGLVAEVAKYATKPSSYIKKVSDSKYYADPEVVRQFYESLKNIRLLGFGGVLKDLRKQLKQEDIEKGDLVQVLGEKKNECTCSICKSTLIEVLYSWRPGLNNYFELKGFSQETENCTGDSCENLVENESLVLV